MAYGKKMYAGTKSSKTGTKTNIYKKTAATSKAKGPYQGKYSSGNYADGVIGKGMKYMEGKPCCGGANGDKNNPDELQRR